MSYPVNLSDSEAFAVFYHNIFEYPLTLSELIRWTPKKSYKIKSKINFKNGFYYIKHKDTFVYERNLRKRISQRKILIAKKAAKVLSIIPVIRMVGISGSLAMNNAKKGSDIDLIIITKQGELWTARILTYFLLKITGFLVRKPKSSEEKDKLCLNIWLDESTLLWPKKQRNIYTAHEILQIIPILNKKKMFESFLSENKWAFKYWPNAQKIRMQNSYKYTKQRTFNIINYLAFWLQYSYLKPKMTREEVGISKAIFHPRDISKEILKKIYLTAK